MAASERFSIIIPVYNASKYLSSCFESIVKQTYKNFEVIVIDDGSTDDSPKICDAIKESDSRFVVIHKTNSGAVVARMVGVAEAKGEYLVFVDSDDWVDEDYLSKFDEVILKDNPDVVCCGCYREKNGVLYNSPMVEKEGLYNKQDIQTYIFPHLLQAEDASYFMPSLWAKAFRRTLYIKNQITDSRSCIGEDIAATIPCVFEAESMSIIHDSLYYYRDATNSITNSKKTFSWENIEVNAKHISEKIDLNYGDLKAQYYRRITHDIFTVAVSQFYSLKPYSEVKQEIINALNRPLFQESIKYAKFSNSIKATLMSVALKRKWVFLMSLYAKKSISI